MKLCYLAFFILLVKVSCGTSEEPAPCETGFSEEKYVFTVTRKVLERGRILGKVSFNTCTAGTRPLYSPDDTRFRVMPDGKVSVKRQITLHEGSVSFVLNAWDAAGKKYMVPVSVWNEREQILGGLAEWEICQFDFVDKDYYFSVPRSLEPGMVVGQVAFNKCDDKSKMRFASMDPDFEVADDGVIVVKNPMRLHEHKEFSVQAFERNIFLSETTVTLRKQQPHHIHGEHLSQHDSPHGLKRQKREWVIPPASVRENERGPFPKRIIQVKSTNAKELQVFYSVSGQGCDSPPVGTFTMERTTGWLSVTRPLDREDISYYTILVHAISANGQPVENPIELIIEVKDQNDNRPFFIQPLFLGTVPDGSKPGTPVMKVTATDLDDTVNSDNGIIRYFISKQEPNLPQTMFTIDTVTGLISVMSSGLDSKLYRQYTLTLNAIDQEGKAFVATGTAKITVTDANDNPPDMSGGSTSLLTTHVLNTVQGIPARGLTLTLSKYNAKEEKWERHSRSVTNEDGRCPGLLRGEPLTAGTFQLRFDTGEYWKTLQLETFYPFVEVVFNIADAKQKYHVPLLISPYSYSTYRGS